MLKKLIRIESEIPVSPGNAGDMEIDWSMNVLPSLSKMLEKAKISAAEFWDFEESFVLDIEGYCGGMDLAAVIGIVRAFGASWAKEKFVLVIQQDGKVFRKDTVQSN